MTKQDGNGENSESVEFGISVLLSTPLPDLRDQLHSVFSALGCEVTTVSNGLDAINQLSVGSFELLVADCQMQPISGLSIADKVKKGLPNIDKNIVIFGLFENDKQEVIDECLLNGMDATIPPCATIKNITDLLSRHFTPGNVKKTGISIDSSAKSLDENLAATYIGDNLDIAIAYRQTYVEKNALLFQELEQALLNMDTHNIFHIVHKLKSSSLFIGAERLHLLCKEAEKLNKESGQNSSDIKEVGNAIISEFNHIGNLISSSHNKS